MQAQATVSTFVAGARSQRGVCVSVVLQSASPTHLDGVALAAY